MNRLQLLPRAVLRPVTPRKYHGLRRTSTSSVPLSSSTKRSSVIFAATVGGSALVAAYLFWPDSSRSAPTYENAKLSPTHFTPVNVTASIPCSNPETRLVTLAVPRQSLPDIQEASFSPIWSVFIKDDDIQVERPYTPLEGIDDQGNLKFWIKRYPKGEVGRWIHSKTIGEQIEIRGPLKTWVWQEEKWDEVVMVSGGTGITPFYQLLHHELFSQRSNPSSTTFTLLHSSNNPGELPPPELLEPMTSYAQKDPSRFRFSLYVDSLDGDNTSAVDRRVLQEGRIGRRALELALGLDVDRPWWQRLFQSSPLTRRGNTKDRRILFLVCGPDPMVAAIAGPFGRNMSQGPVGGILGEMGYKSDQVWKL
ncbi:ferredoxin reductase-like C-terminal NADP-linked domain-containing protein [Cristinia sonorae]|uniref:Ferredoxin reductase-like C-terminal NADP-linked domain-containing protein n=1 Tax=Cristinia sonorae TaxID=1940300 RepID=A0A8K0XTK9_9AGAR|nr:ferredoxin reductase-like C-terminal NADP-linked domain-containing protein [Cristinia sonorae]